MLTNQHMVAVRPHVISGVQRIYRFSDGHGLSVVNCPIMHSYPFAWEIAVLNGVRPDGKFYSLDYSTSLTSDVEVFMTDEEANAFIEKAAALFEGNY